MRLLSLLVLLCACSGGGPKGGTTPGARDAGTGARGDGATADPDAPLTAAECDAFIDHLVDLAEQQRAAAHPEEAATAEEIAAVKASRREKERGECLKLPRPVWQCAMAAQSPQAYVDCAK